MYLIVKRTDNNVRVYKDLFSSFRLTPHNSSSLQQIGIVSANTTIHKKPRSHLLLLVQTRFEYEA